MDNPLLFWGVWASPFQLKLQALADANGLPWRRLPAQGGRLENLAALTRITLESLGGNIPRFRGMDPALDEYPSVPFYSFDGRRFLYDSTDFASHLDASGEHPPLVPDTQAEAFICRLIDEAFDEFGLYMVHHNRWVNSARTNTMGKMTAQEFSGLLPGPIRERMAKRLPRRQVRRCPYLFSVSPRDFQCGMPPELTPPALDGFPPTHELLDTAWERCLAALEEVLIQQPFLLGQRFTLADASVYGQLAMNLVDGATAERLAALAPHTYAWLQQIQAGEHKSSDNSPVITGAITSLMAFIAETFIPLMQQNCSAYEELSSAGQRRFNEPAFDAGEALYNGELLGDPFKAVVKTFQVRVWRDLCEAWTQLPDNEKRALCARFPVLDDPLFSA